MMQLTPVNAIKYPIKLLAKSPTYSYITQAYNISSIIYLIAVHIITMLDKPRRVIYKLLYTNTHS